MRFPILPVLILALPFIEIAGFVLVGNEIGVLATLALVVAAAMLGAVLLRVQGFGVMARIRREVDAGRDPSGEVAKGVMVLFAGILLLIPGFFTDFIGLLLFLPPVREFAWRMLKRRVVVSSARFGSGGFSAGSFRRGPQNGSTIDLDEDEYSRDGRGNGPAGGPAGGSGDGSPWRRIDRD